jgi:hypothetical protein
MSDVLPKRGVVGQMKPAIRVAPLVLEAAALDAAAVYGRLATRAEGLTAAEAAARLSEHGPNVLARDQRPGFLRLLWRSVINPLVILRSRSIRGGRAPLAVVTSEQRKSCAGCSLRRASRLVIRRWHADRIEQRHEDSVRH